MNAGMSGRWWWVYVLGAMVFWSSATGVAHAAGSSMILGDFENGSDKWGYYGGWEFPGARGMIKAERGKAKRGEGLIALTGDFSQGGSYVAMQREFWPPVELKSFSFSVKSETIRRMSLRLRDITGQTFQRTIALGDIADWKKIEVDDFAEGGHWGGANDGTFRGPVTLISFMIGAPHTKEKKGVLYLDAIKGMLRKSSSSTLSVSLGSVPKTTGLYPRIGDGKKVKPQIVEKGRKECWGTACAAKALYLYLNVRDDFAVKPGGQAMLSVTYWDEGEGFFAVQYDARGSATAEAGRCALSGSKKWKTKTFVLANPNFGNKLNGDDIRIGLWSSVTKKTSPVDVFVRKVKLKRAR